MLSVQYGHLDIESDGQKMFTHLGRNERAQALFKWNEHERYLLLLPSPIDRAKFLDSAAKSTTKAEFIVLAKKEEKEVHM